MAKIKVAEIGDLQPGEGKSVEVNRKCAALFNLDGTHYAIEDFCTHAGAPLGDGRIRDGKVMCSWHGAEFCIKTGKAMTPPAFTDVRSFPVTIDGNDILIDFD